MKATYTAFGGRLQCEVQGDSIKEIIRQIGPIAEILDSDAECGCCKSTNIHPRCRVSKEGFDHFELVCSDCGAQMPFGQSKDMKSLFPKRKEHADTRGWSVYVGDRQQSNAPASGPKRNPNRQDPELERLVGKLNNMPNAEEQEWELSDLHHAIVEVNGEAAAEKAWESAKKQVGPLEKDLANAGKIARLMWPALRG